jgi:hypothetical protein
LVTQYLNYTICCLCDVLTWQECDYSVCQLYIWRSCSTYINSLGIYLLLERFSAQHCKMWLFPIYILRDAVIWFVRSSTQATLVANMTSFFVWTLDKQFYMCIICILIFWVMILCNLLNSYQILEETFTFILTVGWRLRLCSYRIEFATNRLCQQVHRHLDASLHNSPLMNSQTHY